MRLLTVLALLLAFPASAAALPGDSESSSVSRMTRQAELQLGISVQGRAFSSYPIVATLRARGVPNGGTVTIERRVGRSWTRVASATVSGGAGYAPFLLPRGRQRLRLSATVGSQTAVSPVRTVTVLRPRRWTTGNRDVGRYRGTGENQRVALRVASSGRRLRDFSATVSTFCVGPTIDTNRVFIGVAPVTRARIAPDGRFYAIVRRSRSTVELSGRVRRGRVKGSVRLTIGTCDGTADFSAKLTR